MIVTRFAPSPTGHLHIGGARTALFSWLYARHNKGKFVLRIEDTDKERSTDESVKQILESLKWLGLNWDEGPYFQSRRYDIYKKYAKKLLSEGKAYRCYCTAYELQAKRDEAIKKGEKPKYDGKCRNLSTEKKDAPFVIRFKTPQEGETVINDMVKGEVKFKNSELDDLVILRTDETPTYNFTVVVDDATMGITCVIRGDDHLNNTPRQVHMYEALGFNIPEFAHIPLILGTDKTRLSKRHGATSVMAYKEMGYLPQAVVNYLARLGWAHGDKEIFSTDELIELFSLEKVGKSASVFNPEKLLWLNSHYLKTLPIETILNNILDKDIFDTFPSEYVVKALESCREKVKTLNELIGYSAFYFKEKIEIPDDLKQKFITLEVKEGFSTLFAHLSKLNDFSHFSIEDAFKKTIETTGLSLKALAQPVRAALTGTIISPGLFLIIEILGKEKTLERLKEAIKLCS